MECPACEEKIEDRIEHEKHCDKLCGDLVKCQECGDLFDSGYGGYVIDVMDIGPDAEGEVSRIFKQDAQHYGFWLGFMEEDLGGLCDDCSYKLQNRRTVLRQDYGYELLM